LRKIQPTNPSCMSLKIFPRTPWEMLHKFAHLKIRLMRKKLYNWFSLTFFSWFLLLEQSPCHRSLLGCYGQFRRSLWRILLHISGESTSKANEFDIFRSVCGKMPKSPNFELNRRQKRVRLSWLGRWRWTLAKIWMMSTFSIIWMVRGPRDENVLSPVFVAPFGIATSISVVGFGIR